MLNNAVDTEKFLFSANMRQEVLRELELDGGQMVIGVVGRMIEPKNPQGIIDIFKAVHEREPKAKLLWVGDGPMREEIKKRIQKEGLSDSVILTGVRADVNRLYQAMDVFIMPSLWEGLPVTAIEAQA